MAIPGRQLFIGPLCVKTPSCTRRGHEDSDTIDVVTVAVEQSGRP